MLKNKQDIEQSGLVGESKRQKMKHGKFEELKNVLMGRFQQARSLLKQILRISNKQQK